MSCLRRDFGRALGPYPDGRITPRGGLEELEIQRLSTVAGIPEYRCATQIKVAEVYRRLTT